MNNPTNPKRKRVFSSQFKTQLVLEYLSGQKSQAAICRENLIGSNLLSKWVSQFQAKAHLIFEDTHKESQLQQKAEKNVSAPIILNKEIFGALLTIKMNTLSGNF